jgi:hypothetical protein
MAFYGGLAMEIELFFRQIRNFQFSVVGRAVFGLAQLALADDLCQSLFYYLIQ